jgi:hypothetical protein
VFEWDATFPLLLFLFPFRATLQVPSAFLYISSILLFRQTCSFSPLGCIHDFVKLKTTHHTSHPQLNNSTAPSPKWLVPPPHHIVMTLAPCDCFNNRACTFRNATITCPVWHCGTAQRRCVDAWFVLRDYTSFVRVWLGKRESRSRMPCNTTFRSVQNWRLVCASWSTRKAMMLCGLRFALVMLQHYCMSIFLSLLLYQRWRCGTVLFLYKCTWLGGRAKYVN